MKANVQYNDYRGTTAADRSDYLEANIVKMTEIIIERFCIPLDAENYQYVGVSGGWQDEACSRLNGVARYVANDESVDIRNTSGRCQCFFLFQR